MGEHKSLYLLTYLLTLHTLGGPGAHRNLPQRDPGQGPRAMGYGDLSGVDKEGAARAGGGGG